MLAMVHPMGTLGTTARSNMLDDMAMDLLNGGDEGE